MTVYKVIGPLRYREHETGETFVADLPPDVEERALMSGAIVVISREQTTVDLASARPPRGWPPVRNT